MLLKRYGFVVHIETPLNLDVDFGLTEATVINLRLNDADSSKYFYTDKSHIYKNSMAFRTRLHGIAIKKDIPKRHKKIMAEAFNEFRQAIDRSGGNVNYNICGIDVFRRVIADLYDPISGECLNKIFLQPKYDSVFKPYTRI